MLVSMRGAPAFHAEQSFRAGASAEARESARLVQGSSELHAPRTDQRADADDEEYEPDEERRDGATQRAPTELPVPTMALPRKRAGRVLLRCASTSTRRFAAA